MTTSEFIGSLNPEQSQAFIAVRDELVAANAVQNGELVALKNAEIQTISGERNAALAKGAEDTAAHAKELADIFAKYAAVIVSLQDPSATKEDVTAEFEKEAKDRERAGLEKQRDDILARLAALDERAVSALTN